MNLIRRAQVNRRIRAATFALVALLALLGTLPALAAGTALRDMTTLAHYYPQDTAVFIVLRSDASHFETLDLVLDRVGGRISVSESANFTYIDDTSSPTDFMIGDEVVLLGASELFPIEGSFQHGLGSNAEFNLAAALLPENDYNLFAYLDLGSTIETLVQAVPDPALTEMLPLLEAVGPMAVGFTVLDDHALVVDMSSQTDPEIFEGFGFASSQASAIDPFFAEKLPADVLVAVQSTDLLGTIAETVTNLIAASGTFASEADAELEQILALVEPFLGDLSELEFGAETFGGSTSDYALFVALNPALAEIGLLDEALGVPPVDVGLVLETASAGAARGLVTTVSETLLPFLAQFDLEDFEIRTESVAGETAVVVTVGASPDMPFPVDLLFAAKGELLILGTRNAVSAVVNPGVTLADTDGYAEARAYMMTGANPFVYLNPHVLLPLIDLTEAVRSDTQPMDDVMMVKSVLGMCNSASLTGLTVGDYGYGVTRLVLTLTTSSEPTAVGFDY